MMYFPEIDILFTVNKTKEMNMIIESERTVYKSIEIDEFHKSSGMGKKNWRRLFKNRKPKNISIDSTANSSTSLKENLTVESKKIENLPIREKIGKMWDRMKPSNKYIRICSIVGGIGIPLVVFALNPNPVQALEYSAKDMLNTTLTAAKNTETKTAVNLFTKFLNNRFFKFIKLANVCTYCADNEGMFSKFWCGACALEIYPTLKSIKNQVGKLLRIFRF